MYIIYDSVRNITYYVLCTSTICVNFSRTTGLGLFNFAGVTDVCCPRDTRRNILWYIIRTNCTCGGVIP